MDEIEVLVHMFHATEATAFGNGAAHPDMTAVRISLTSADGSEAAHVMRVPEKDEPSVQKLSEKLEELLNGAARPDLKCAAIGYLLMKDLAKGTKRLRDLQE